MKKPTVLLIDASPLIYSTWNTTGHFSNSRGENTGLRYGFLRAVNAYCRDTGSDKAVICYDAPGATIIKAKGVDGYKANRVPTEDKAKMWAQVPKLKELLAQTKFTQIEAAGFEADDIVGSAARDLELQGNEVLILTTDNDLCQVVSENIRIWMPSKSKTKEKAYFKDWTWVVNKFGVSPVHLLAFRAIVGDVSDNLEGCLLSNSSAAEVATFLASDPHHTSADIGYLAMMLELRNIPCRDNHREIIARNLKVMKLDTIDIDQMTIMKGAADPVELMQILVDMEAKSMYKHVPSYCGTAEE